MKIIKNLCITATMGIFAINANSAFGISEIEFRDLKTNSAGLIAELEAKNFSPEIMGCIAGQLCGCSETD